jgi:type IV secretion system protein VirB8
MVDRTTGYVQAVKPLDVAQITPDAALTQAFLVQYVIARESFDISAVQTNYRKVASWSAERARSDYLKGMQVSNPESPLAAFPRTTVVETRVKSVSPIGRDVALVRFDTIRQDAGGQTQPARSWVSVIRYRYSGAPMQLEERFVNPLGFQVLRYRRDAEAIPAVQTAPAPAETVPGVVVVPGAADPSAAATVAPAPDLRTASDAALRAAEQRRTARVPEPEL